MINNEQAQFESIVQHLYHEEPSLVRSWAWPDAERERRQIRRRGFVMLAGLALLFITGLLMFQGMTIQTDQNLIVTSGVLQTLNSKYGATLASSLPSGVRYLSLNSNVNLSLEQNSKVQTCAVTIGSTVQEVSVVCSGVPLPPKQASN